VPLGVRLTLQKLCTLTAIIGNTMATLMLPPPPVPMSRAARPAIHVPCPDELPVARAPRSRRHDVRRPAAGVAG